MERAQYQMTIIIIIIIIKETAKRNAPNVGLEPTTLGLRVPCSTD